MKPVSPTYGAFHDSRFGPTIAARASSSKSQRKIARREGRDVVDSDPCFFLVREFPLQPIGRCTA